MIIRDYKIFKSELSLYKHYIQQYNNNMNESKKIIESLSSLQSPSGVTMVEVKKKTKDGVKVSQIPSPKLDYDPMRSLKKKEELYSLSADLEQEAYMYKMRIDDIKHTLNHLPKWLKNKCLNTFVNGLAGKLAKEQAESKATYYRHLDDELKEYLKK